MLICQDGEREVDQEDKSDEGMEEVGQEGGFKATDGCIGYDFKYTSISVCMRY